jgi:hypothetical protein
LNQLYGTAEQLGYDSSVELCLEKLHAAEIRAEAVANGSTRTMDEIANEKGTARVGSRLSWAFTIENIKYQTTGDPLAYDESYFLLSRGVRVFKVINLKDPHAEPKVVKDFHPFAVSRREIEIQDDILNRLGEENTEGRKFFLTIDHDELLAVTKILPPNYKHQQWSLGESSSARRSQSTKFKMASGTRDPPEPPTQSATRYTFQQRQHRRVVFREVCVVIPEISDSCVLLRCLKDIIKGLSLLLLHMQSADCWI